MKDHKVEKVWVTSPEFHRHLGTKEINKQDFKRHDPGALLAFFFGFLSGLVAAPFIWFFVFSKP